MEMGFCNFSPNQRTLWWRFFQAQNGNINLSDTLFRSTIMFLMIPAGVIIQKKHTYWLNPPPVSSLNFDAEDKKSIARVTHLLLVGIWIFLQISWVYIFFSLSENFDQFQPIISKLDRKIHRVNNLAQLVSFYRKTVEFIRDQYQWQWLWSWITELLFTHIFLNISILAT